MNIKYILAAGYLALVLNLALATYKISSYEVTIINWAIMIFNLLMIGVCLVFFISNLVSAILHQIKHEDDN